MKEISLLLILFVLGMFMLSCDDDESPDTNPSNDCDQQILISDSLYTVAPADTLAIDSFYIVDDCLNIRFGASGCDGESWELELLSGEYMPNISGTFPYYDVRLSLLDQEDCEAFITQEVSYDISNLQVQDTAIHVIQLNIRNAQSSILYRY